MRSNRFWTAQSRTKFSGAFFSRFREGGFEALISLVIAANPTKAPFTSLTGEKDMQTSIGFPPFRM